MYKKEAPAESSLKSRIQKEFLIASFVNKILSFDHQKSLDFLPLLLVCSLFVGIIFIKSFSLFFCLSISLLLIIMIQAIGQQFNLPRQYLIFLQILAAIAVFSLFWLNYFAEPAHAQFFKKAEDFFQTSLTQGTDNNGGTKTAISLVFNILRAIFLLYIAGSLIGIINAVRKDEEWQSVARTPLLVVIAVTLADVLTSFIIGDPGK